MNQPPPPSPQRENLIGVVLSDRYKVVEAIGEGGMGSVYLAEHVTLGKRVALKVLKAELAHDKTTAQRFLREAKATSSIEHENVVDILDFGETPGGSAFFAMEHLRGRELTELMQDEIRLPWHRVKPILLQLSYGLGAAHDNGIVHRDMKPGNVFLIRRGGRSDFVKLLDFGIAKVEDETALTRAGMVFGTAAYMAPEQATASGVDGRSDMYALACMAFEMLTGRLPFDAKHPIKMLNCHIREPAPSMRTVAPEAEVPEAVDTVILRALSKLPDERYANMYAFAGALEAIPAEAPAVSSHIGQTVSLPPASSARGPVAHPTPAVPIQPPIPVPRQNARPPSRPSPPRPGQQPPPPPHAQRGRPSRPGPPRSSAAGELGSSSSARSDRTEPRRVIHTPQTQQAPPSRPRRSTMARSGGPPRPQARRAPAAAGGPPKIPGISGKLPPVLPGLAWLFVSLAESAAGELGNKHLLEIAKRLWPWAQSLTLDELNALVRHTLADYRALPDVATRGARTREHNMELAKLLPRPRLAEILTALYGIASDDGRVRDAELRFIVNCTMQLGLSPDPRLLATAFLYVMLCAADGHIDDSEHNMLRDRAKHWAPQASIAERAVVLRWAIAEFKRRPTIAEKMQCAREAADQLAASTDRETLRVIINDLWRLAGADGHISPQEQAFINEMVQRFRL